MKKLYLRLLLISVNIFIIYLSVAQVTVTATSGNMGPVTYSTLKAGFDAINLGTHTGAITIRLTGSTSELASAVLKADGIMNASYTSVLIKPETGTNPVISGNFASTLIVLDGAKNVRIDGSNLPGDTSKNLTISNTSPDGNTFTLMNGASSNSIINSIIKSSESDFDGGTIVLGGSNTSSGNNYNTFENNDITGHPNAYHQIAIQNLGTFGKPNTGNIYRNNRISDFASIGFSDGDSFGEIGFSSNTLVDGNEFYSTVPQTLPCAILINHPTGIKQLTISNNIIHNLSSMNGMLGILLLEAVSVTVINNFISLSDSPRGIKGISQETGAGAAIKIYHNTVHISGTTSGENSFAFYKNWYSTDDKIYNNIFINTRINNSGTQGQYAFVKVNTGSYKSDYNNLVSTGNSNNYVGAEGVTFTPTRYASLADWQAGTTQDSHSISIIPAFVSTSDLHIVPDSNIALDNLGLPIADVGTDIDGDIRSTSTPDIGADEFNSSGGTALMDLDESISSVILMPNLVNSNTTLRVHAHQSAMIRWFVVDIEGKVVLTFKQQINSGQNDFQINLAEVMPGIYQIIGRTAKGRTGITRFVKCK